jgi:hypothetical protein
VSAPDVDSVSGTGLLRVVSTCGEDTFPAGCRRIRIIESTATLGAVRQTRKVVRAAGGAAVGDAGTARTEVVTRLVREVG